MNVDINSVQGTGPKGRIVQADVLQAKSTHTVTPTSTTQEIKPTTTHVATTTSTKVLTPEYEDIENSQIRKVIAERLAYSKSNIPHFYIGIECNVDKVMILRAELNKHSPVKLSFNDIVIKAASLACMKVPETNSSWMGNFIRKYKNVDMSVAVQTDSGLITPIITSSNLKGLVQISKEMKDLAERAKIRKLKPQEFQGGTFTISNMGMFGISNFSAVINPPQVNKLFYFIFLNYFICYLGLYSCCRKK
jgi:pyruvate dehydrogenase E2 component (dihydrolipoamide acetyltransferase)